MAKCPNCGKENYRYELRSAGTRSTSDYYRTGVKDSWFIPVGQKTYRSQRKQKAVGICPDCGYIKEKHEKGCFFYLLCLLFFPISVSVWFYKTNAFRLDKKRRIIIIAVFWVLICIGMGSIGVTETKAIPSDTVTQNAEYAPLSDFDYYIDDNTVILKRYKGHLSTVKIAPSYEIDGQQIRVVGLDGTFALKSVDNVIVPEGVTEIVRNTFNSSNVKIIYLPSTLTDFSGWNYFHNVQVIYFGGTQEQWNTLYTDERSKLDVVQIICDANVDAIIIE